MYRKPLGRDSTKRNAANMGTFCICRVQNCKGVASEPFHGIFARRRTRRAVPSHVETQHAKRSRKGLCLRFPHRQIAPQ
jgi:hypothetical protein